MLFGRGMAASLAFALTLHAGEVLTPLSPGTSPPASGSGNSSGAVVSANGRWVVFGSQANNLLSSPLQGNFLNLFVRDLQTSTDALVSIALDGTSGNGASTLPAFTADARRVVFRSTAQNLVTNRTSGQGDIFLRDLDAATTTLVSIGLDGAGASAACDNPVITPDGRYVAFESRATNLVATPTSGFGDIYVRDLQAGKTVLVSVQADGADGGSGRSWDPSLSADGRFVSFLTLATNLDPEGTSHSHPEAMLHDIVQQTNVVLGVDSNGLLAPGAYANAVLLSTNGQFVLFEGAYPAPITSTNTTLVNSLYQRDNVTGTTRLIATNQLDDVVSLSDLGMSADGRIVVYNQTNQVFAWNRDTGTSVLVSANTNGTAAAGVSCMPAVSDDGSTVTFVSNAPDLVNRGTPGSFQVYRYDLVSGTLERISTAADGSGGGRADNLYPVVDASGGTIAFEALDSNLVPDDDNRATDVFARQPGATNVVLVSAHAPTLPSAAAPSGGELALHGMSADGRFVLFTSDGDGLVSAATHGVRNVYLHDTELDTNLLVSVNPAGDEGGSDVSYDPTMTPDGRYVAFVSAATNLVSKDLSAVLSANAYNRAVYLRDMTKDQTELISVLDNTGTLATGPILTAPVVSADGRYVAFMWMPLSSVNQPYLFIRDRQESTTLTKDVYPLVSAGQDARMLAVTPGPELWYTALSSQIQGAFGSYQRVFWHYDATNDIDEQIGSGAVLGSPAISTDGRTIAYWDVSFRPAATNLVWWNRSLDTNTTLASVDVAAPPPVYPQGLEQWGLTLSTNGHWIATTMPRNALLPGNTNTVADVVLCNTQQPGNLSIVSLDAQGAAAANGYSDSPQVSANGRYVAFRSYATNLVPGPTPGGPQIYLRDLLLGVTRRLTLDAGNPSNPSWCLAPAMSSDATQLTFSSWTANAGLGDFGPQIAPFLVNAAPATTDSNNNGIPDDWELHYFGDLTHNGTADSDGDGASDYAEYVAGTNPMDAKSVLALSVESSTNGVVTFSFPGTALRTYQIQYKDHIGDAVWHDLSGPLSLAGPGRLQFHDTVTANSQQRYYRVLVSL